MTKYIICLSGKGGVGKSVTSINLATALKSFGKEVALVDGNITTPNITDTEPGLHILHYVKATTEWNSQANHQMKSDMENKRLLFPKFDVMSIDIAQATDQIAGLNLSL